MNKALNDRMFSHTVRAHELVVAAHEDVFEAQCGGAPEDVKDLAAKLQAYQDAERIIDRDFEGR